MPKRPEIHQHVKHTPAPRLTAHERGYGARWRKARLGWLRSHPLCASCEALGLVVAGTDVDHIVPHKGDMALFWKPDNWQTLCRHHHSAKTATEDGGFGRAVVERN